MSNRKDGRPGRRKVYVGEVAFAIGTTTKALQLWIERYSDNGLKPSIEQTGHRHAFGWGDIAALSVTRYLVDLGLPPPAAFLHAIAIVKHRWPKLFDQENPSWELTPDNMVIDFHVGRGPVIAGADTWWGVSSFDPETTFSRIDRALEKLRDKEFPARVAISVFIGPIIADAFIKLGDMGHSPPVPARHVAIT